MASRAVPIARLLLFPRPAVTTVDLSDERLVALCADGDAHALDGLFRRHGDAVYRFLARMPAVDRRDIDDLVQTTFVEVCRAARGFAGRASVGVWILSIAVNVMRHYVRGEVRRRVLMTAAADQDRRAPAPARPDETAAGRELVARLEQGLAELPADLQLVFTLCDLEELRGIEVARMLGMRRGTLWRKLHQARTRLRSALEAEPLEARG